MPEFLAGIVDALSQAVNDLGLNISLNNLGQAIIGVRNDVRYTLNVLVRFMIAVFWWIGRSNYRAAQSGTIALKAANDLGEAFTDIQTTWEIFLGDKYPTDLHNLYDKLAAKIPAQQRINLKPIEDAITRLQRDDRAEKTWQDKIATPTLNAYRQFSDTFKRTYAPPLGTLIDWLATPSKLADFALPAFIVGLPRALSDKAAQRSATAIEAALVGTWVNDPAVIGDLVARAMGTEL